MAKMTAKDKATREHALANKVYTTARHALHNGKSVEHIVAPAVKKPGMFIAYQVVYKSDGTLQAGKLVPASGAISKLNAQTAAESEQARTIRVDQMIADSNK